LLPSILWLVSMILTQNVHAIFEQKVVTIIIA